MVAGDQRRESGFDLSKDSPLLPFSRRMHRNEPDRTPLNGFRSRKGMTHFPRARRRLAAFPSSRQSIIPCRHRWRAIMRIISIVLATGSVIAAVAAQAGQAKNDLASEAAGGKMWPDDLPAGLRAGRLVEKDLPEQVPGRDRRLRRRGARPLRRRLATNPPVRNADWRRHRDRRRTIVVSQAG